MDKLSFKVLFLSFLLFPCVIFGQFYNGSIMDFGKNRVQYSKRLYWTYYGYDHYDVFFYEGGREIAKYVSKSAKKNIADLEKTLDYDLAGKLQFMVYNKQSEFQQSNLGLAIEQQNNPGGATRIIGSKIAVYFEGDHNKLDAQIRAGVADILVQQMLYGGNAMEMVKSSTLLTLPNWYTNGLVSYLTEKWSTATDAKVRDGILSGKFKKFNQLSGKEAELAGHSIWNYIAETYGEQVIPSILYMVKTTRSTESAFLYVLGTSMENLSRDYLAYYELRYKEHKGPSTFLETQGTLVLKKPHPERVYTKARISPDGKGMLYVTNELGQYKVWFKDLTNSKRPKRLVKSGYKIDRITDYSYPLLAWHPSGQVFSMITEEKGSIWLYTFEYPGFHKEKRTIINFDKILDFAYSDDGKTFAMSAVQKGQSDIFIFTNGSNGYEQVTKDIYDDLHPRFVHGSRELVFSSNRPNDTIKFETEGNYKAKVKPDRDIFVYNCLTKSPVLKRLTHTPGITEDFPNDYDSTHYSFISDQNGVNNRYVAHFDSVLSSVDTSAHYRLLVSGQPITNLSNGIIEDDLNLQARKTTDIVFEHGKYWMRVNDLIATSALPPLELKNTIYQDKSKSHEVLQISPEGAAKPSSQPTPAIILDSNAVDINNFVFLYGKQESPPVIRVFKQEAVDSSKTSKNDSIKNIFKLGAQKNYYINFSNDHLVTQLDNNFLNSTYQPFNGGPYIAPNTGALIKVGMSDLFEDFRFVGGVRVPFDLASFEYFLSFENRRARWDQQLVLHRIALPNVDASGYTIRTVTHEAIYSLKYPFSEVACIKFTGTLRNDKNLVPAVDYYSLTAPDLYETWGVGKVEYVFDNTRYKGLNLLQGLRFKLFYEHYRRIDQSSSVIPSPLTGLVGEPNVAPPTDANQHNFNVLGMDVRFYQKIHRNMIWASRVAASSSFGPEKLIYYMGGVDNWFNPQFDYSSNISPNANYVFQTLASPMRGFIQNVRNGNNFFVVNNEIRWPIFSYFIKRPIRSDIIANFQLIGFADVGTAWYGNNLYSNSNATNTIYVPAPPPPNPVTVIITHQNEPLVGGFGGGVRTRLFGYFVRVDYAKGIENRVVLPSGIWYLSLGLDF